MEKAIINTVLMTHGSASGTSFQLTQSETMIGRDPENDICVIDEEVSRFHCTITSGDGQVMLMDDASSNGTIVNGKRIQQIALQPGDRIQIGQSQFVFDGFLEIADTPDLSELTGTISHAETETLSINPPSESDTDSSIDAPEGQPDESGIERRFVRTDNDLRFIYDASLTTSRNVDTPKMLGELMDLIFEWIQADRGCVMLADNDANRFKTVVTKFRSPDVATSEIVVNQAIVNYVCQQKAGVMSPSPMADNRWRMEEQPGIPAVGEVLCVPIQGQAELLGVIYVDTLHQATSKNTIWFSDDHLRLMLAIAHQAAVAIENESYFSALVESERMIAVGDTTAMMSHRINNILQGINGGSHLVEMGLTNNDNPMARKGWEIVRRNQEQISQLMKDLIFLSRPFEPQRVRTDLRDVVVKAIDRFQTDFASDSINIRVNDCPVECEVSGDIESLLIAIINVLKVINRASKLESNPSCDVALVTTASDVQITFNFCGTAISPKPNGDADFLRNSKQNVQSNGGIDLEVCRKIVRGHDGSILISSTDSKTHQVTMSINK